MKEKDFEVKHTTGKTPILTSYKFWVKCNKPGLLEVNILDKLGRSHQQANFDLKTGSYDLQVDVTALKGGQYNAWFHFKDQAIIKKITISPKTRRSAWKTLFS